MELADVGVSIRGLFRFNTPLAKSPPAYKFCLKVGEPPPNHALCKSKMPSIIAESVRENEKRISAELARGYSMPR